MSNKQTTAMQELVRQINGAIQIIDEHGKLNDYAQCRKEVYQFILDVATELLTKERELMISMGKQFANWNGIEDSDIEDYFTQTFKQD